MKSTTKIVINSVIAGLLVFFGAAVTTLQIYGIEDLNQLLLGGLLGFFSGIVIFLSKLQSYLSPELAQNKSDKVKIFDFI